MQDPEEWHSSCILHVRCPTPGRWNRMHYSCIWGAGFEVSVCIMNVERIRIVMLYWSLALFLSLSVYFSLTLPLVLSVFLSVTLSLSQSFLICSLLLFLFLPSFTTHTHRHAHTHKHLLVLSSWFNMSMFPFVGRCDWLKPELLKGHTHAREASV